MGVKMGGGFGLRAGETEVETDIAQSDASATEEISFRSSFKLLLRTCSVEP